MAALSLQVKGVRMRLLVKPGGRLRRRKSAAALIADFAALQKCLMLCAPCVHKLPQRWQARFGYRRLRDMHSVGRCDYCQDDTTCTIFHHEAGEYVAEWERLRTIEQAIEQQYLALRRPRRVKGA